MNIVFMGTPDFAAESLRALVENKFNVSAVFCQPDKKQGRGMKISECDVKKLALQYGIKVYQPTTLKDKIQVNIIKELNPDLIVVVAYGKLLPESILNIPKYGCINVHGSLLPKYRGAAPIQWSVINGDKETGITTMYMDKGLDTGDIILQEKLDISENETSEELFNRMMVLGGEVLVKTLKLCEEGKIVSKKQDDKLATYASLLSKEMGHIDFSKPAREVHNLIRGLYSWPCAYSSLNGKRFKILSSKFVDNIKGKPGEVIFSDKKRGFVIACGDDCGIKIERLQFDGKKAMDVKDFFVGNSIDVGTILE